MPRFFLQADLLGSKMGKKKRGGRARGREHRRRGRWWTSALPSTSGRLRWSGWTQPRVRQGVSTIQENRPERPARILSRTTTGSRRPGCTRCRRVRRSATQVVEPTPRRSAGRDAITHADCRSGRKESPRRTLMGYASNGTPAMVKLGVELGVRSRDRTGRVGDQPGVEHGHPVIYSRPVRRPPRRASSASVDRGVRGHIHETGVVVPAAGWAGASGPGSGHTACPPRSC